MCLSTVYKNTLTPETVMMRNVMRIECRDGVVILTDLMERQMAIEGTLEMANWWTVSPWLRRASPYDWFPGSYLPGITFYPSLPYRERKICIFHCFTAKTMLQWSKFVSRRSEC